MERTVFCGICRDPSHLFRTLATAPVLDHGCFVIEPGHPELEGALDSYGMQWELANHSNVCQQRNQALELAQKRYPGHWAIFLDIGEVWHGDLVVPDEATVVQVGVGPETCRWSEPRVARLDKCVRWVGPFAPYLELDGEQVVATSQCWVEPALLTQWQMKRDLDDFELSLSDQRTCFFAAEMQRALGNINEAAGLYAQAAWSTEWVEMSYMARLRLASVSDQDEALLRYWSAISELPHRPEGYLLLAELARKMHKPVLQYAMACGAIAAAERAQGGFMVNLRAKAEAHDLMAVAHNELGDPDEAFNFGAEALQMDPSNQRLVNNFSWYVIAARKARENAPPSTLPTGESAPEPNP